MKLIRIYASAACALAFSFSGFTNNCLRLTHLPLTKRPAADLAFADSAPSVGSAPAPGVAPVPGGYDPGAPGVAPMNMNNPGVGIPGAGSSGIGNPGIGNPGIGNPGIGNPGMGNPGIGNSQGSFVPNSYASPGSIGLPGGGYPPANPAIPATPANLSTPAVPVSPTGTTSAPPAVASPDLSSLEDYTSRLRLAPGLTMLFPIQQGCDRSGRALPSYSMAVLIEKKSKDCSFSYKWTMSELNATGVRAVDEAAKRNSRKVSLFYKPGEQCTLVGYTDAVRVSDAMYHNLKNGTSSPIELDGPFGQAVRHSPSIPLPQNISNMGIEELAIQVDERKVKVRAIKAVGDNPPGTGFAGNWTYWILDNANFPMMLKGTGPFVWDVPIINTNGTMGDAGGSKEGKRIVNDLKKKGIASTNAILFDFDSDKLKPSATPILNEVTSYLRSNHGVKVAVQGHCDNVGGMEYNLNLSRRRAKSVRQYLVNAGIGADRLQSEGYGYSKPVASNKTEAGRAKNRRVVFKVTAK
jgi:outer membrane protein OmpA-like peptidoglycan-associated protein